jgi:hypothetical protein
MAFTRGPSPEPNRTFLGSSVSWSDIASPSDKEAFARTSRIPELHILLVCLGRQSLRDPATVAGALRLGILLAAQGQSVLCAWAGDLHAWP